MDSEQTWECHASAFSGWDTYYKVVPNAVTPKSVTPKVKSNKCSKPLDILTYHAFNIIQQTVASGKTLYSVSLPVLNHAPKTVERYQLEQLQQEIDNWVEQNF